MRIARPSRAKRTPPAKATPTSSVSGGGDNLWAIQVLGGDGHEYVLASDRDCRLYIFEYTGKG
jgi:hypothetical protein